MTDIAGVMAAAMNAENDRRRLAASRPGHGAPVPTPQSPAGAGIGISDVDMPAVGLGFSVPPTVPQALTASYVVPSYADDMVAGVGFTGGKSEPAIRVYVGQRSAPAGDGIVVASGPSRPGLLTRLRERFRKAT